MSDLSKIFGSKVFNDALMRERLPKATYKKLKDTIENSTPLDPEVAETVASTMKDWAIENGATHFSHWFQPMTGITAEKHDSFISPTSDGRVILEFSGKELIKGEPDASSFPNGGIRATFEARGYTVWDCTSPAFLKDTTLCIPTAFCSYTGEALDKKTPLLRSMDAISQQGIRVLRALGNTTSKKVISEVGAEQEYFIIDRKMFDARKDLIYTGRTLFGAKPPKGQEMDDHYFGTIKKRVMDFMKELDEELWKLGVPAKTRHNEVAPAQHEIAPIFGTTNVATDQNQMLMETLKRVAEKHNLACLLHEKPFAGVNGSGKHNNWSIATDDGICLLKPGKEPHKNTLFLLMLACVLKAVDVYADTIRSSASNPGNDHRLGANEAPPAIISIFLGDQLTDVVEQIIEKGEALNCLSTTNMGFGTNSLPIFAKDTTDRNRTSPFAYTGNKFEFRMVGSSASISGPNFVINSAIATVFKEVADRLEASKDANLEVSVIIREFFTNHKRVIFNGDNYTEEWVIEAERRGLHHARNMVDAKKALLNEKNVKMFTGVGVLSEVEVHSRYEILVENYINTINIEALTALDMAKRDLLPAVLDYMAILADSINKIKTATNGGATKAHLRLLTNITELSEQAMDKIDSLESALEKASTLEDITLKAEAYRDSVFVQMNELRTVFDKLEILVDARRWPIPTYAEIFNSVK